MTGLLHLLTLSLEKRKIIGHLFCMVLVGYLGHRILHPVAVPFLSKPLFGIDLTLLY